MRKPYQLLRHTSGFITALALLLPYLNAIASLPTTRPNHRMSDVEYSMSDVASGLLTAETHAIDHLGNTTASRTAIDRIDKTVYRLTHTPGSTVAALSLTVNGLLEESTTSFGHTPPTTPPTTSITPFAPAYDQ